MANENGEVQQSSCSNEDDAMAVVGAEELLQQQNITSTEDATAEEGMPTAFRLNKNRNAGEPEVATAEEDREGSQRMKLNDLVADLCINRKSENPADGYTNDRRCYDGNSQGCVSHCEDKPPVVQQAPTQNSSFSFKHFLNSSSSTMTAPSSTITVTTSGAITGTSSLQTSTGARPKVPQSTSASTSSISSLIASSLNVGGEGHDLNSATKMKRSPRFSSFDSQASLAEYTTHGIGCGVEEAEESKGFRGLCADALGEEGNDFFNPRHSSSSRTNANMCGSDYDGRYVTRSQSNYEMPRQHQSSASRRRATVFTGSKETRPTRLALNTTSAKLKLDLPIESASASTSASATASSSSSRPLPNNAGEFPPIAAAVLPDFVQDHWMDSWYAHEMHLNSPPNSPIRGFMEDGAGAMGMDLGAGGAVGGGGAIVADNNSGHELQQPAGGSSKMLPDFLSDGPIIHSSQRLADVAAGLPSNSIGSPEDVVAASQLTNLRIENESLQRELSELRCALSEQTRRADELETRFQNLQSVDIEHSRSVRTMSQNIKQAEESSDISKRQAEAAQSQVFMLKQQVTHLTSEVEELRSENQSLRREAAFGGYSSPSSSNRHFSATAASTPNVRTNAARPSRSQQLSRQLQQAASNAENNLRQLLTGVDNLRQMAAEIDNSKSYYDSDESP